MVKSVALVYMVAGMSSRFGGKVKQLVKVGPNDETLIEYSLNQALKAGFSKIIFIVGDKTETEFRRMFGDEYMGVPVFYARQKFDPEIRDKPWGTVDALCCAREFIDCPFVICNGDDIYGEESFRILVEHLLNNEESASVGFKLGNVLSDNCGVNRGIFQVDEDGYLKSMEEIFNIEKSNLVKKGLSVDNLCSMNIFGLHSDVLEFANAELEAFKRKNEGSRDAECLLPVEFSKLMGKGLMRVKIYSTSDKWTGVTGPEDAEVVRALLKI